MAPRLLCARLLGAHLALFLAIPILAQDERPGVTESAPITEISVGDDAPPLQVSRWIKGEPIRDFEKGHVYVVDFWATWCGPCIRAMPHMTETQKRYDDQKVTVVGVSIWESDQGKVAPFVEKKGNGMGYTVAMDRVPALPASIEAGTSDARRWSVDQGEMSRTWMEAAGRGGIPSVFIVDGEGRIAWIGHPAQGMDEALANVVAGTHDLDAARAAYREEQAIRRIHTRFLELLGDKKYYQAFTLAEENLDRVWGQNASMLNRIAWTLVDPQGDVENPDLDLALRAAERANDLTEGHNAAILDTLARVHFARGNIGVALRLQRDAVRHADERTREEIDRALEEYRRAARDLEFH